MGKQAASVVATRQERVKELHFNLSLGRVHFCLIFLQRGGGNVGSCLPLFVGLLSFALCNRWSLLLKKLFFKENNVLNRLLQPQTQHSPDGVTISSKTLRLCCAVCSLQTILFFGGPPPVLLASARTAGRCCVGGGTTSAAAVPGAPLILAFFLRSSTTFCSASASIIAVPSSSCCVRVEERRNSPNETGCGHQGPHMQTCTQHTHTDRQTDRQTPGMKREPLTGQRGKMNAGRVCVLMKESLRSYDHRQRHNSPTDSVSSAYSTPSPTNGNGNKGGREALRTSTIRASFRRHSRRRGRCWWWWWRG